MTSGFLQAMAMLLPQQIGSVYFSPLVVLRAFSVRRFIDERASLHLAHSANQLRFKLTSFQNLASSTFI